MYAAVRHIAEDLSFFCGGVLYNEDQDEFSILASIYSSRAVTCSHLRGIVVFENGTHECVLLGPSRAWLPVRPIHICSGEHWGVLAALPFKEIIIKAHSDRLSHVLAGEHSRSNELAADKTNKPPVGPRRSNRKKWGRKFLELGKQSKSSGKRHAGSGNIKCAKNSSGTRSKPSKPTENKLKPGNTGTGSKSAGPGARLKEKCNKLTAELKSVKKSLATAQDEIKRLCRVNGKQEKKIEQLTTKLMELASACASSASPTTSAPTGYLTMTEQINYLKDMVQINNSIGRPAPTLAPPPPPPAAPDPNQLNITQFKKMWDIVHNKSN